jgi:7,8-dihydropterin-6-yl-methyl-4-(beta-D-ribofuranosyl)aminobenzene 5'-phosphate synthase
MNEIRDLKITTLAENMASQLLGQWGLSFLIQVTDARGDKRKIVLDSGLVKDALLYNLKKMELKLNDLDAVVISHGHLDHTATTVEFVKDTGGVKVYAHPHTFLKRFHQKPDGRRRSLGVPEGEGIAEIENAGGTVVLSSKPCEVVPGMWTTGQIERLTSFETPLSLAEGEKLVIVIDGNEISDMILDDQALWMDVQKIGPYVITGCAHAGPVNTLLHVEKLGNFRSIHGLVGGTHLVGRSEEYLQKTIQELQEFGLELISPCHCTGFKATARLWQTFPEKFVLNFSGRIIAATEEPEDRLL